MEETQTNTVWKEHGNQKLWWFCTLFLSIIPTPNITFFNKYNKIMNNFLWDSSSHKIKNET